MSLLKFSNLWIHILADPTDGTGAGVVRALRTLVRLNHFDHDRL